MSSDGRELLVLARCGRILAEAAARAGYRVTTIDCFGDIDTRRASRRHFICRWERPAQTQRLLQRCLSQHRFDGCIYGGGLESQPRLLEYVRRFVPIWGNPPRTLARLGEAAELLRLLAGARVPHPESHLGSTASHHGPWLRKRAGCSGGVSVMDDQGTPGRGESAARVPPQQYWQRKVAGRVHSLLFLADGQRLTVVGWNELLKQDSDYRYHGAVTRFELTQRQTNQVLDAAHRLVEHLALRGLCGLDFVSTSEQVWIIDINPRPTATLELHDTSDGALIGAHIYACRNRTLPRLEPGLQAVRGQRVIYAAYDGRVGALHWPDWCHDLPAPGTTVQVGQPLCSVNAQSQCLESVLVALAARARRIEQAWTHDGPVPAMPLCA